MRINESRYCVQGSDESAIKVPCETYRSYTVIKRQRQTRYYPRLKSEFASFIFKTVDTQNMQLVQTLAFSLSQRKNEHFLLIVTIFYKNSNYMSL